MGDRGNVLVRDDYDPGVFLYTHWGGSELPSLVQTVLKREVRWDDSAYLARMVFSAMIKDEIDRETGYGISSRLNDNEYPILVLDSSSQQVLYIGEEMAREKDISKPLAQWSMEDYITAPEDEITRPFYGM